MSVIMTTFHEAPLVLLENLHKGMDDIAENTLSEMMSWAFGSNLMAFNNHYFPDWAFDKRVHYRV